MGYSIDFFKGLGWNGGLKIASKGLTAIKLAVLARLLLPHDFGIFSLVLVSISLIEVFTETGINTTIVQSKKPVEHFIDTAWVVSIVRGFFISLAMIAVGQILQTFYFESQLFNLVLLASLIPIIRGFINPAIVTFHKELKFSSDTFYRFSLVILDVVASIILGLWLRNVIALILPMILTAIFEVSITFMFVRLKPKLQFNKNVFLEIFHNTKWLNGFSVLDYLNKNLDDLIVGKILGTNILGLYRNSFSLTQSATAELGLTVIHASFPVLTKIDHQQNRFGNAVKKVIFSFSGLLFLPTLILVLFPEPIVKILLGEQWLSIIPIIPLLAVSGYLQGIINISGPIFIAKKKYHFLLSSLFLTLVTMIASLLILAPQIGFVGIGWSILLSKIVAIPFIAFFLYRTTHEQ